MAVTAVLLATSEGFSSMFHLVYLWCRLKCTLLSPFPTFFCSSGGLNYNSSVGCLALQLLPVSASENHWQEFKGSTYWVFTAPVPSLWGHLGREASPGPKFFFWFVAFSLWLLITTTCLFLSGVWALTGLSRYQIQCVFPPTLPTFLFTVPF